MSLFETKIKEIIFNPTPLGNRILRHDFRSLNKAQKLVDDAVSGLEDANTLPAEALFKAIFEVKPFEKPKFTELEYVG